MRLAALVALVLVTGCASSAADESVAVPTGLSMTELMKSVIDPAANVVFAAGGEVSDAEGTSEITPESIARWREVAEAAGVLQQTGRMLLEPPYVRPESEWRVWAEKMIAAGQAAEEAAAAQDADAAFVVGGDLYDSCNECHRRFIPGRQ